MTFANRAFVRWYCAGDTLDYDYISAWGWEMLAEYFTME